MDIPAWARSRVVRALAGIAVGLGLATLLVVALDQAGVAHASSAYLLVVIALAVQLGTAEAILAAAGGFLLANYLFTEPIRTLTVLDPGEWLNLLLLLVVGVVVGQLAGQQRGRAQAAELRAREARGLFQVSRALATAPDAASALPDIVRILLAETGMSRVWIGLSDTGALEHVAADTGLGEEPGSPARHEVLKRMEGDIPARWIGLHAAGPSSGARSAGTARRGVPGTDLAAFRVVIEAGERALGSVWALRPRSAGTPRREETRLLAAAADQVGQALERDRLRRDAMAAEAARQSESLKSALLDSVSHELRTPIAAIRAAAGQLATGESTGEANVVANTIERQAIHLDRLVTNLLDMGRIEAGELRPDLRPVLLDDAVADTVERLRGSLDGRDVTLDVPEDLPPVVVDEVYLDAIVANLVDNARKYSPPEAPIRVAACRAEAMVRLQVEDGGAGVPDELLPRLFEKFFRAPSTGRAASRGSGIGLAIVRGLTDAMGGRVSVQRSTLGGLAVNVDLPATDPVRP
jgi:two-component system sensor histidine kinase KdpD